MEPEFPHVMVDLETTGTQPENTAILQLSAVRFNLFTKQVDSEIFDRCMFIPPSRFWDEATREWWGKRREILRGLLSRAEEADRVLPDFQNWVREKGSVHLVAKPSHFEYPFIESYYKSHGLQNPFHYRRVLDMNSVITGMHFPNPEIPEIDVPFDGPAHNAIYDVFHQIKTLFAHAEASKNARTEAVG